LGEIDEDEIMIQAKAKKKFEGRTNSAKVGTQSLEKSICGMKWVNTCIILRFRGSF